MILASFEKSRPSFPFVLEQLFLHQVVANLGDGFVKGPYSAKFHSQSLNFFRDDLMFGKFLSPKDFRVA